jgi:zona occludens toxin (predicted ATPase)
MYFLYAKNEDGYGRKRDWRRRKSLWAEGKIVFLLSDTMRAQCLHAQCKHKCVYQTGPNKLCIRTLLRKF